MSVVRSQTNAAWPSEARMVEAFGGADVTVASFQDTAGRFPVSGILPVSAQTSAYSAKGGYRLCDQNTRKLLMESIFSRQTGGRRKMLCAKFVNINIPQTTFEGCPEQNGGNRHSPCEDEIEARATSQNVTVKPDFDLRC